METQAIIPHIMLTENELDIAASRRFPGNSFNSSAGVTISRMDFKEGTAQNISGNAKADNSRGEVSAAAVITPGGSLFGTPHLTDIRGRLGSGIYYADGIIGAGKPSTGSFALIARDRNLPEGPVLVNPSEDGAEAGSGILGAAVITSLPDYYEKQVIAELPELPMDYSLDSSAFIVETGYRTGTALLIKGGRLLYGSGRLVSSSGEPVRLKIFQIMKTDR
jgi:outer membrane usher protein FimD/PapC